MQGDILAGRTSASSSILIRGEYTGHSNRKDNPNEHIIQRKL